MLILWFNFPNKTRGPRVCVFLHQWAIYNPLLNRRHFHRYCFILRGWCSTSRMQRALVWVSSSSVFDPFTTADSRGDALPTLSFPVSLSVCTCVWFICILKHSSIPRFEIICLHKYCDFFFNSYHKLFYLSFYFYSEFSLRFPLKRMSSSKIYFFIYKRQILVSILTIIYVIFIHSYFSSKYY